MAGPSTWRIDNAHPFDVGDAAAIEKLFADQIRPLSPRFNSPVRRGRAVALVGCFAPALVWLRDHKGVIVDFEVVRFATDLRWITKAALEGIVLLRDPASGDVTEMDVRAAFPDHVVSPLRRYLIEIPGYDLAIPLVQQACQALEQHSFVSLSCLPGFDQHHAEA